MHYRWGFGILIFFLGSRAINRVNGDETRECPRECVCYRKFATVKCEESSLTDLPRIAKDIAAQVQVLNMAGSQMKELKSITLSHFPSLKRLVLEKNKINNIEERALENVPSLTDLDLSNNNIRSLHRGVFSQHKLKRLYLENNPFSCNKTSLMRLLGEIKDLMNQDTNLEVFDGGMLRCAEPPDMKGKRIIDLDNVPEDKSSSLRLGVIIGVASGATALLASSLGAVIIVVNRRKSDCKYTYYSLSSTEEDSLDQNQMESIKAFNNNQEKGQVLEHRLKKLRRQSQGYPMSDSSESEDDAADQERYIKKKMMSQRRQSMGFSKEMDSDGMEEIDLNSH